MPLSDRVQRGVLGLEVALAGALTAALAVAGAGLDGAGAGLGGAGTGAARRPVCAARGHARNQDDGTGGRQHLRHTACAHEHAHTLPGTRLLPFPACPIPARCETVTRGRTGGRNDPLLAPPGRRHGKGRGDSAATPNDSVTTLGYHQDSTKGRGETRATARPSADEVSHRGGLGGVQPPAARHALELVLAAVGEAEARAGDQVLDGGRDEHFRWLCQRTNAGADVDGDAAHI